MVFIDQDFKLTLPFRKFKSGLGIGSGRRREGREVSSELSAFRVESGHDLGMGGLCGHEASLPFAQFRCAS